MVHSADASALRPDRRYVLQPARDRSQGTHELPLCPNETNAHKLTRQMCTAQRVGDAREGDHCAVLQHCRFPLAPRRDAAHMAGSGCGPWWAATLNSGVTLTGHRPTRLSPNLGYSSGPSVAAMVIGSLHAHRKAFYLMRISGTVKFFNSAKGFGFIQPDQGGKDVFVHATALEAAGIRALNEGDRVSFELEDDRRGRGKQAAQVKMA